MIILAYFKITFYDLFKNERVSSEGILFIDTLDGLSGWQAVKWFVFGTRGDLEYLYLNNLYFNFFNGIFEEVLCVVNL